MRQFVDLPARASPFRLQSPRYAYSKLAFRRTQNFGARLRSYRARSCQIGLRRGVASGEWRFSACPPSRHCLHSPALNLSATHHTTDLPGREHKPGREHSHSLAYLLLLCSAFHPSKIISIMQYIQHHKHYAIYANISSKYEQCCRSSLSALGI